MRERSGSEKVNEQLKIFPLRTRFLRKSTAQKRFDLPAALGPTIIEEHKHFCSFPLPFLF